ncbi:MAG: class I SAM-dependent methyltransferase [Acidimicrobiia bacterium]
MTAETTDRWAKWLLHDRFAGDRVALRRTLELLEPIRDRVLAGAAIEPGDVVLDVGCGDGLIGFAALGMVGDSGQVVFADISEELLDHCRQLAAELDVSSRCRFLRTAAEILDGVADSSVDVVTTRSVLIYVEDKAAAFAAFRRVLKSGGRLSLFEPINRRYTALNRDTLFGYDASPIAELAVKVMAVFEAATPPGGPMMGFDETDLLRVAETAGFANIIVTLELSTTDRPPFHGVSWEQLMKIRPNPNAPTFGDAIVQALTTSEIARLESHFRPLVDSGTDGRLRRADAYLTAKARSA